MNTKKVCLQLKVTPKMLRIYEQQGLISPKRLENSYREYSREDLFQIEIIVRLRELGFSIKEIKGILQYHEAEGDYMNSFYIQIKGIENRIKELNAAKRKLQKTINRIINHTGDEPIMDIIYEASGPEEKENAYEAMIREWDFDIMATDYVERFLKENERYKAGINCCRKLIEREDPQHRLDILDVGCGTCNLWEVYAAPYQLTAMDSSLNMLIAAQNKVPWAKYCLADITSFDKREFAKFDLVISTFTLHHIEEDRQELALKNMIDLCRAAGKVILIEKYFQDPAEQQEEKERLKAAGKQEALSVLTSEHYLFLTQVEEYVNYLRCSLEFSRIAEHVGCFVISARNAEIRNSSAN